ncbi:MAG: hypothetical protein RL293_472 [Bacteroidota bacterium]|jgi:hypothetical protein
MEDRPKLARGSLITIKPVKTRSIIKRIFVIHKKETWIF